jgi:hypothetical protein
MSVQSDPSSLLTASGRLQPRDDEMRGANLRRSLNNIGTNAGMLLLRGLLRQIIHKGALTVIVPDGSSYHFGSGSPSITIRIADSSVIPRWS